MKDISTFTETLDRQVQSLIQSFSSAGEKQLNYAPPKKWNAKEILGHLCDSALENLCRYHHIIGNETEYKIRNYPQDYLVESKRYASQDIKKLVSLFEALNFQIANFISYHPNTIIGSKLLDSQDTPTTLSFWLEDYLSHMQKHTEQIQARFTASLSPIQS